LNQKSYMFRIRISDPESIRDGIYTATRGQVRLETALSILLENHNSTIPVSRSLQCQASTIVHSLRLLPGRIFNIKPS